VNHDSYHMFKCQSDESIIARTHKIMRTKVMATKGNKVSPNSNSGEKELLDESIVLSIRF
jgi:hypothetical protein